MREVLFLTGIGTNVGKTVAAAVLMSTLKADYWKPVQCGSLESSDAINIASLVKTHAPTIFPERYKLKAAMSPHAAAALEGIEIKLSDFKIPDTNNSLVIEGAGGALVPLNSKDLVIDIAGAQETPVVIVSQHYLGSINHTLLTIEAIKSRNIPIRGIIWNGELNPETESVIQAFSNVPVLGRITIADTVTPEFIEAEAARLAETIGEAR